MPKTDLKPHLKIDEKGRIVIPKIIRNAVNAKPGNMFEAEVYGKNKILLTMIG